MHDASRTSEPLDRALYEEHLRLNATFGEGFVPMSYRGVPGVESLAGATVLADVSHVATLLISGEPASGFVQAAFAGKRLSVGSCAFEAVLTGDGALASVPLLARTGEAEYIALDLSSRAEVLDGWLSFLAGIEQNGVAPFEGLQTNDATGSHAVLMLWGQDAVDVLRDYVGKEQDVPRAGQVSSLLLDRIPCIVASLPALGNPCFLVFVPPVHAAVLWRSILSFVQVTPVGAGELATLLGRALPWATRLDSGDVLRFSAMELARWGLIRETNDYVGARGISQEGREPNA